VADDSKAAPFFLARIWVRLEESWENSAGVIVNQEADTAREATIAAALGGDSDARAARLSAILDGRGDPGPGVGPAAVEVFNTPYAFRTIVPVLSVNIDRNPAAEADKVSVRFLWNAMPVDPRAVKAALIEVYGDAVHPSLLEEWYATGVPPISIDPEQNRLLFGVLDDLDVDEVKGEVSATGRDLTGLLIDEKFPPKAGEALDLSNPLDEVIRDIVQMSTSARGMPVVWISPGAAPVGENMVGGLVKRRPAYRRAVVGAELVDDPDWKFPKKWEGMKSDIEWPRRTAIDPGTFLVSPLEALGLPTGPVPEGAVTIPASVELKYGRVPDYKTVTEVRKVPKFRGFQAEYGSGAVMYGQVYDEFIPYETTVLSYDTMEMYYSDAVDIDDMVLGDSMKGAGTGTPLRYITSTRTVERPRASSGDDVGDYSGSLSSGETDELTVIVGVEYEDVMWWNGVSMWLTEEGDKGITTHRQVEKTVPYLAVSREMSFWDVIQDICTGLGCTAQVVNDTIVLTWARTVYFDTRRVHFVPGLNCSSLRLKKSLHRAKQQAVQVRCWDTTHQRVLESRFPANAPASGDDVLRIVHGYTSQDDIDRLAAALWFEVAMSKVSGSLRTSEVVVPTLTDQEDDGLASMLDIRSGDVLELGPMTPMRNLWAIQDAARENYEVAVAAVMDTLQVERETAEAYIAAYSAKTMSPFWVTAARMAYTSTKDGLDWDVSFVELPAVS